MPEPFKFFSELTQIHPITGRSCTQDEYEAAGGKVATPRPVRHKWFNEPMEKIGASGQIIKDIEPYKPAAVDKDTGQRPVISGRRQHREFLRNNGYIEIGNSFVEPKREELSKSERVADIRRAMNDF
jgi:hypothetical protein